MELIGPHFYLDTLLRISFTLWCNGIADQQEGAWLWVGFVCFVWFWFSEHGKKRTVPKDGCKWWKSVLLGTPVCFGIILIAKCTIQFWSWTLPPWPSFTHIQKLCYLSVVFLICLQEEKVLYFLIIYHNDGIYTLKAQKNRPTCGASERSDL